MHSLNDVLVPVLQWLVLALADGENRRPHALLRELSDLSIAKRLPKRREPLKEISELCHQCGLTGVCKMTKRE